MLFSRRRAEALGLLLGIMPQLAAAEPAPSTLFESYGALSTSPRDDRDPEFLFLGGILRKEDDDAYRRLLNSGADPSQQIGPERIYSARVKDRLEDVKPAFQLQGFHVNDPATLRAEGAEGLAMFFTRGTNRAAETCRQKDEPLRTCPAYLAAREIALARSGDDGATWKLDRALVSAKDSGDGAGPGQPAAIRAGQEVWLYYTTGNPSFMAPNVFRLRLSLDLLKRLADPERLTLEGFAPGLSLENVQLVRLQCDGEGKFVTTMVANNRAQNEILFYLSTDGLHFKPSAGSILPYANHTLASPTQMPGPASAVECAAAGTPGIPTQRDLLYAEQASPLRWLLRRAKLRLTLP